MSEQAAEFTPSDDEIRRIVTERPFESKVSLGLWGRWLAAHDAKVRADEREECAKVAESDQFYDDRGDVLSSDEVSYNTARSEAGMAVRSRRDNA